MPTSNQSHGSSKRNQAADVPQDKNAQEQPRSRNNQSLMTPHEAIISELAPKYDVLAASVISSTQIRKRVVYVTNHLLEQAEKPRIALLYARTAEVGKMITVVEQCKRVLGEEGKPWYQHNQLFDLPEDPIKKGVVEETMLGGEEDDGSDSDDFEVMNSRFEEALLPPPSTRSVKSMRIFLSTATIPELRLKKDVTVQSSISKP